MRAADASIWRTNTLISSRSVPQPKFRRLPHQTMSNLHCAQRVGRPFGLASRKALPLPRPSTRIASSSSCGSTEGTVTSSGCGKGSCGSGGGCSSNPSVESILAGGGAGVGTMSAMMMGAKSSQGISRADMAMAFQAQPSAAKSQQGERVISISELLASCPDNLVWEDFDEESN